MNVFSVVRPDAVAGQGPEYAVNLYQAAEEDLWIAESDALPLATEAPPLGALIDRVWEIAPEIAELNGHKGKLNLRFVLHTSALT